MYVLFYQKTCICEIVYQEDEGVFVSKSISYE
jgi:hypothetical protein